MLIYLEAQGYLQDVVTGDKTIQQLAAEVRRIQKAAGHPVVARTGSHKVGPPPPDNTAGPEDPGGKRSIGGKGTRERALSVVLAIQADKDQEVQAFRRDALDGDLMKPDQVRQWILNQADEDGPHTIWHSEIPIPPGHEVRVADDVFEMQPPLTISEVGKVTLRVMEFYENGLDGEPVAVKIKEGVSLDQLRSLSQRLARTYFWRVAQATCFLLTNGVPIIDPIEGTVPRRSNYTALTRIVLSIDPTVSPREVAQAYGLLRGQVVGPRHRDLTLKHHSLAVFYAQMDEGKTWAQRMKYWNEKINRPEWQYKTDTNFARNCTKAYQRLTSPDYRIPGKGVN